MENVEMRSRQIVRLVSAVGLACIAFVLSAVICLAQESTPVHIAGMVELDEPCPPASKPTQLPQFRQGDVTRICFGDLPTTSGPTAVNIGLLPATVGDLTQDGLVVSLPDEPGSGTYVVSGTINGTQLSPFLIQFYPTTRPSLTGVSPAATTRGSAVRIDGQGLAAPKDNGVSVWIGNEMAKVSDIAPDGSSVVVNLPDDGRNAEGGPLPVEVYVWGVPASLPTGGLSVTMVQKIDSRLTALLILGALLPLVAITALIYWLFRRQAFGPDKPTGLIAGLLYDADTQTYSLSRAQFFWWLLISAYAYSFLFLARGATDGVWTLPGFNGMLYTLVISTATLLTATATTNIRGGKGSGAKHPSPSDLILHGGVIAPERVQQVLWTFLAGIAVLWIVVSTYATATTLPDIPQELLILMGLSSAAYIGGKVVRAPGPIIRQVDLDPKPSVATTGVQLIVSGDNLEKTATVMVNGTLLARDSIVAELPPKGPSAAGIAPARESADINQQLVSRLRLFTQVLPSDWAGNSEKNSVIVVNSDGQRSEWPVTASAAMATLPAAAAANQLSVDAQSVAALAE